jgi:hypothetical protein
MRVGSQRLRIEDDGRAVLTVNVIAVAWGIKSKRLRGGMLEVVNTCETNYSHE